MATVSNVERETVWERHIKCNRNQQRTRKKYKQVKCFKRTLHIRKVDTKKKTISHHGSVVRHSRVNNIWVGNTGKMVKDAPSEGRPFRRRLGWHSGGSHPSRCLGDTEGEAILPDACTPYWKTRAMSQLWYTSDPHPYCQPKPGRWHWFWEMT